MNFYPTFQRKITKLTMKTGRLPYPAYLMPRRIYWIAQLIVFCTLSVSVSGQKSPTDPFVQGIYTRSLTDGRPYEWLHTLCKDAGHRLSGSAGAERAVRWAKSTMDTLGFDSVWLQPVIVPHWERGAPEQVRVEGSRTAGSFDLRVLALGGSVGTDGRTITAEVVEAKSWSDLERLGEAGIKGKIVFFNRPMDPAKIRSFEAYGGVVDQRVSGASRAARYGAVGVLVRSMTQNHDDWPHTGSLRYDSGTVQIPAVAVSTNDADKISKIIKKEGKLSVSMRLSCQTLADVTSYNVIGQIRGSERPNEFIIIGGHLDSWDVGEGAHDDGAGCVQSMEALSNLRKSGWRPRHTLRCVLFMNEENGLRGGRTYAAEALRKGEIHRCAIESDAGGFTPRGFTFEAESTQFDALFEKITPLRTTFEPMNMTLNPGGSGADISPLKGQGTLLCGYYPDSQRYFDFHHTAADVFESVNKRELELGAASIATMLYLMDQVKW
jgi:carboxypeptidase Q